MSMRMASVSADSSDDADLDRAVNGFLAKNHAAPAKEGVR